jgi:hypothetical protein
MKIITLPIILFFLMSVSIFSQSQKVWGTKFDYDYKTEVDPKVVLVDNYNHFMVSVINIDGGMLPTNQIIVRKFDQKNQLVNTFTTDFPYKDVYTLHNYLGSVELGADKLAIFTDCYSNRTKKKEIHKIIFDKKTNNFTTTLVSEFTFESLSKSGVVYFRTSQNKKYISVIYGKYSNKKIAEEYVCTILDGTTSEVVWQKNIAFPLLSYTENMVLSNSGKIIFIRSSKETGDKNILAIADANTIENKDFGDKIQIQNPIAFSIGTQDYLIAFNSEKHTLSINSNGFQNILLYDVNLGKVIKNNTVRIFDAIKDLQTVSIKQIFIQDNEIHLFVDCSFKTGTKPDPSFPNSTFQVPVYSNGEPAILIFSMDGELKNSSTFKVLSSSDKLIKCFDVQNIKGTFYINTMLKNGFDYYHGIFKLNGPDYKLNFTKPSFIFAHNTDPMEYREGTVINQFSQYLTDSNRIILAKYYPEGKIAFVNITGINL